jgi:hypothetical protein
MCTYYFTSAEPACDGDFATAIRLVRCNIFLKGRGGIKLRAKTIIAVLMAGIFCACAATLISTLWVVLFLVVPAHAVHDLRGFLSVVFSILFIALVPACPFGFGCGVICRLYLLVRSAHIATTVRLISEGCGSFRFPYFCEIKGQLAGARAVTTVLFF